MRFFFIDMRSPLLLITLLFLSSIAAAQEPSAGLPRIADPVRFDQWGDLSFDDEKARLDNAAIQLRDEPGLILYLVLHAAKQSCVGEARARGVRAKNYLVRYRHVNPRQVIWIDAGYRDDFVTDVWIWPPNMQPPAKMREDMVSPNELRLDRHCRIKCRSCASGKRRA